MAEPENQHPPEMETGRGGVEGGVPWVFLKTLAFL